MCIIKKTGNHNMKKLFFVFLLFALSLSNSQTVFSKSSFSAAVLVDDNVITFYDIDQKRRLLAALTGKKNTTPEIEEILIMEKIQEIYAGRLNIKTSDAELDIETTGFLKSNNISKSKLKSILAAKGVDYETFIQFLKINVLWRKVLDFRYGYKIGKLNIKDNLPLPSTPVRIEKEYQFSEIFISFQKWGKNNASLLTNRLFIELKSGANFGEAAKKFSSSGTSKKQGFVGSIEKNKIPNEIKKILDSLKPTQVSQPLETESGFWLFKLHKTKSYRKVKSPKYKVTYSVFPKSNEKSDFCSIQFEKYIKGPIKTEKLAKKTNDMLNKLMPGDSIEYKTKDGATKILTLCERVLENPKTEERIFQARTRNEEAIRLSDSLLIELRRTTTIVKK